jgi:flavodoxin
MLGLAALMSVASLACTPRGPDAVSGATTVVSEPKAADRGVRSDALIITASAEGGSTMRIAKAVSEVLDARVVSPRQAAACELRSYGLIGFGSGIFDQKHHASLLEFVDHLPVLPGRKAFIFSTSGVARQVALNGKIDDPHTALRERLRTKGFEIVGEFNCAGFNDNSFLKFFGGMNKGKPDAGDLERARAFAAALKGSAPGRTAGP